MARKPRFGLLGIPQHVIQRGNNREPCFYGDEDYHRYLNDLKDALRKNDCRLHAYVLGRALQGESRRLRGVPTHLHAIHRNEPGSCRDGVTRGRVRMVELRCQCARLPRHVALAPPDVGPN